jgi:flagellar hook-associated protein 3 FlgL
VSTRITNNMIARSLLSDLNAVSEHLTDTRRKMSSGKEITRPSDDPYLAGRAVGLRGELEAARQRMRNVNDAKGWQAVTDTALALIGDLAQRARELTVQGATDALPQTSRDAIADEIDHIIAAVKQEANATYDGRYVLGGTRTDVRPYDSTFSSTPNDAYGGDTATQLREIGPGVTLAVNVRGDEVLGGIGGAQGNLLGALRDVVTHLRAGDTASLSGADLRALTGEMDNLLAVRARLGAATNRLETASARLSEFEESATALLSETEDADMARTLVDFSTQQAVYQSALNAGARIVQSSLLDFLR